MGRNADRQRPGPGGRDKGGQRKPLGEGLLGPTPGALKAKSFKSMKKQAKKTVNPGFKAPLHDIKSQTKSTLAYDEKRAADNQFYLDWLDSTSKQMAAHARAADLDLQTRQQQMQDSAATALQAMRDELVQNAPNEGSTVTNPNQALSFDLSDEAQRGLSQIANERNRTSQDVLSGAQTANAQRQSNFALMAASDANRQADTSKRLAELGDTKIKIKMERAAARATEVARLLDQEISKAESRINMKNLAAQTALQLRAQRLEKKKFRFDKREALKLANEEIRHNKATESIDEDTLAETIRSNLADEKLAKLDLKADKQEAGNDNAKDRRERAKEYTKYIENGISAMKNDPELRKLVQKSPKEAANKLSKAGYEPLFAQAVVQLMGQGYLSPGLAKRLKSLGYDVPGRYLNRG